MIDFRTLPGMRLNIFDVTADDIKEDKAALAIAKRHKESTDLTVRTLETQRTELEDRYGFSGGKAPSVYAVFAEIRAADEAIVAAQSEKSDAGNTALLMTLCTRPNKSDDAKEACKDTKGSLDDATVLLGKANSALAKATAKRARLYEKLGKIDEYSTVSSKLSHARGQKWMDDRAVTQWSSRLSADEKEYKADNHDEAERIAAKRAKLAKESERLKLSEEWARAEAGEGNACYLE